MVGKDIFFLQKVLGLELGDLISSPSSVSDLEPVWHPFWASLPLICKIRVLDPLVLNRDEFGSHLGRYPKAELYFVFLAVSKAYESI